MIVDVHVHCNLSIFCIYSVVWILRGDPLPPQKSRVKLTEQLLNSDVLCVVVLRIKRQS